MRIQRTYAHQARMGRSAKSQCRPCFQTVGDAVDIKRKCRSAAISETLFPSECTDRCEAELDSSFHDATGGSEAGRGFGCNPGFNSTPPPPAQCARESGPRIRWGIVRAAAVLSSGE